METHPLNASVEDRKTAIRLMPTAFPLGSENSFLSLPILPKLQHATQESRAAVIARRVRCLFEVVQGPGDSLEMAPLRLAYPPERFGIGQEAPAPVRDLSRSGGSRRKGVG